ncbi:BQ5605_C010g06090 [Microbotryum silenes-dioicae]|uniref:BQ5605_C010g06090 protein n=1 Tax=Microbotryum silenes-dioicae TaxID=796604 RepID=A0A2X0LQF9_9BASI|nr:BQ5605_C010g06090 [Microbotryum silenes-dioicae]
MPPPTLVLPESDAQPPPPQHAGHPTGLLPDLPHELLIALGQAIDRDALDSFVLSSSSSSSSSSRSAASGTATNGGGGPLRVEEVLNELIPDEQAIAQTPLVSLLLRAKIQDLRIEIQGLTLLLEQDQSPHNMTLIQELIGVESAGTWANFFPSPTHSLCRSPPQELLSQVTAIRNAATESEMVVREITRDIQSLDLAKRNLVASITALKRFQMLGPFEQRVHRSTRPWKTDLFRSNSETVSAFDQLNRLAKSRRYRETAQALGAVKQLSSYFKTYGSVDRVAAVSRGVVDVQGVLRTQVMRDFEEAFASEASRVGKNGQLADACLVIDALGEEAKNGLFSWYTVLLLRDYRKVFGSNSEAGQLDNISRRFAWFRRILKTHEDENGTIFPSVWSVGAVLAGGFSEVTRDDLKSVLQKAAPGLQVGLLLEALGQTVEFERELSRKFTLPFDYIASLSAVRSGRSGPTAPISAVFEPYLGIFVDAQDKTLSDMMGAFTSSRVSISPSDNPSAVLPSSTELFYFYREALERCAKLSVKQPLLDLCKVYRKWLKVYAEDVLAGALVKTDRRSVEGRGPSLHELQTACLVLNTAEYCLETATQLEERLIEKIDADLKAQVSLEREKDLFVQTTSASLLAILKELEMSLEGPFNLMLRSPWRDVEYVSNESPYVADLVRCVETVVTVVRDGVEQKKYVRSVCDKIVGLVLAKFTQTIVRCRPIAQIGAEQILLDLQSLKTCLLHLVLPPGDTSAVPMSYSRYVSRSVTKIDTLLKVIMTPEEPAEEFVKNYLVLVPCQSFSDFQKVLDLKGVRRAEQNNLLDIFLARTSTATGLDDTSFLTSLDMDPNATFQSPSGSGVSSPLLGSSNTNSNALGGSMGGGGGFLGLGASTLGGSGGGSGGSREGSRTSTPIGGFGRAGSLSGPSGGGQGQSGPGGGSEGGHGHGGKEALAEFRKFGQRIGMASRLFSGREGAH